MSFEKSIDLNYQRARKALVEEISSKGISDLRVLDAFLKTPRHLFIDGAFSSRAYQDMSLPIGYHQTISQPFVVARMIELILKGNIFDKTPLGTILEIGTGCGYQTAILSNFCRKVFSIERISPLAERAKKNGWSLKILSADHNPQWSNPEEFAELLIRVKAVSYTHLTLPTNREV